MKTVLMLCLVFSAGQKEEAVKAPVLEKTTSLKNVAAPPQKKKESQKKGLKETASETASEAVPEAASEAAPEAVSETPPPSAYDRQERIPAQESEHREDSFSKYLVRTVFSLIFIVGLMYFLAKLVLPRYLQGFRPNSKAQHIKVLERTPLDAKHSVYVLELEDGERILVGTGEKGVQFLTRVDRSMGDTKVPKEFNSLLASKNEEEAVKDETV
ncbi:MAG: flagellar biosynthetic protein FliO [Myxococcota bacterium]|nr:flagellar biosynthetic protein FliO [Myxococcota bacterium]